MVIVFVVLTLVFYLIEVVPQDPTRFLLPRGLSCGLPCSTTNAQIIAQWALDRPVLDRYIAFLGNILQGNLGVSTTLYYGVPVSSVIMPRMAETLLLLGAALIVAVLLGLAVGVPLSRRRGRAVDSLVSMAFALGYAAPVFGLALLLIYGLAVLNPIFPVHGAESIGYANLDPVSQFADRMYHLALPILTLVVTCVGLFVWTIRDHPLGPETSAPSEPGLPDSPLHKPTLLERLGANIPRFLPAIPAFLGWMMVAVVLVEFVFDIQGLGPLLWTALVALDVWVLVGMVVVVSLVLLLPALLAADVIHFALTRTWGRLDGLRSGHFRVDPRDLLRGPRRVLTLPLGLTGAILALIVLGMTLAAPILVGPYPTPFTQAAPLQPPSPEHPLGTDYRGMDILALTVYGGWQGLPVAIFGFAVALMAGLGYVAALGFFGERAEVFLAIPVDAFLVLSLPFAVLLALTTTSFNVLYFTALLSAPVATRILRMEVAGLVRENPAVMPFRGRWRARSSRALAMLWGTGPILVGDALLGTSLALAAWGSMGFLGFVARGYATWGQMLNNAVSSIAVLRGQISYFLAPFVALLSAVLAPMLLSLACKAIGPRRAEAGLVEVPAPVRAEEPVSAPLPHPP